MMAVVGLHLVLNYMDMLSENICAIGHWFIYPGLSWCILVYFGLSFITIKLAIWVAYPWPSPVIGDHPAKDAC